MPILRKRYRGPSPKRVLRERFMRNYVGDMRFHKKTNASMVAILSRLTIQEIEGRCTCTYMAKYITNRITHIWQIFGNVHFDSLTCRPNYMCTETHNCDSQRNLIQLTNTSAYLCARPVSVVFCIGIRERLDKYFPAILGCHLRHGVVD